MTISIAWIRSDSASQELMFSSDSRLSGDDNIDQCQKVFPLPREDCCILFSGVTAIEYPFILQVNAAVIEYKKSYDRAVDVTLYKLKILSLLNSFVGAYEGTIEEDFKADLRQTNFIFGGWSWHMSRFRL